MKKFIFSLLAIFMAATMSVNAAERGKLIHVDISTAKNLKPQLAFCQDRKDGTDITTLLVKTVNVNAFNEFNDASRVLIRFSDGVAVRLNRVPLWTRTNTLRKKATLPSLTTTPTLRMK